MHPEPINSNSRLRASDADREQAADVLSTALAEGRLTVAEHSERLDAIYQVKTQAEIVPLLDDLPAQSVTLAPAPSTGLEPARGGRHNIVAILGGASRSGNWHVEPNMSLVTILGGAELDFRDVQLPAREIRLNCTCVFGGVEITVPPEMRVVDSGWAIFGARDIGSDAPESADPNAPVLRLTGFTVFGGMAAKRKERKQRKEKRR